MSAGRLFAGVDVGAKRKGFHIAVLDHELNVVDQRCETEISKAVDSLAGQSVAVVAVDSPRTAADSGERERRCEQRFRAQRVCGIRPTPDEATIYRAHPKDFYEWIINGFDLYRALDLLTRDEHWEVVECFPTATWTRLHGGRPRGKSRAAWSRDALGGLHLEPLPPRMNQDQRDALGAAYTAWLYGRGETDPAFAPIFIPREIDRAATARA